MTRNTRLVKSRCQSRGYHKYEQNDPSLAHYQTKLGKYTISPQLIAKNRREARYG